MPHVVVCIPHVCDAGSSHTSQCLTRLRADVEEDAATLEREEVMSSLSLALPLDQTGPKLRFPSRSPRPPRAHARSLALSQSLVLRCNPSFVCACASGAGGAEGVRTVRRR